MLKPIDENGPIVAFMLTHYAKVDIAKAFSHLVLDRFPLQFATGLRFWRLLGVGKGRAFDPQADLQRYALFTIWDSYTALQEFEAHSATMHRILQQSAEVWRVHMRPVQWHGKWGGRDPLAGISPASPPEPGPWVILTRATLHAARRKAFLDAVPAVSAQLLQQQGYINSVGVGESPFLHQATVSLWRTLPSVTTFAYGASATHIDVIRRTRSEKWYSEELFARFRPVASFGTWDGVDPLAVHQTS